MTYQPQLLDICTYGDPVLREKCTPIEAVTPQLMELAGDMIVTMLEADGIGLAAPQVNVPIQMMALGVNIYDAPLPPNASPGEQMLWNLMPCVVINPKITPITNETSVCDEGCLSIPGINGEVVRPSSVQLEGTIILEKGNQPVNKPFKFPCSNMLSTCIQHEADHLSGVMFVDRLDEADKKRVASALKKLEKRTLKKLGKK